jgi:hypothetical protein
VVPLHELVGSLVASVAHGQAVADASAAVLGTAYQEHEHLRHFPSPRPLIADVELTVPVALAAIEPSTVALAASQRQELAERLARDFHALAARLELTGRDGWERAAADLESALRRRLDLGVAEPLPALLGGVAEAATGLLHRFVDETVGRRDRREVRRTISEHVGRTVRDQVLSYLATSNPVDAPQGRLEVLASSSELAKVSPECVAQVRIRVTRRDLQWLDVGVGDDRELRLLPQ